MLHTKFGINVFGQDQFFLALRHLPNLLFAVLFTIIVKKNNSRAG
jgi:hypothetical protein